MSLLNNQESFKHLITIRTLENATTAVRSRADLINSTFKPDDRKFIQDIRKNIDENITNLYNEFKKYIMLLERWHNIFDTVETHRADFSELIKTTEKYEY
jgi:hypothetical protein